MDIRGNRFSFLGVALLTAAVLLGLTPPARTCADEAALLAEHVFGGLPVGGEEGDPVLVRQGYVLKYDVDGRVPVWVAYHVKPDYRKTPKREGKFKAFRTDPDAPHAVKDDEYTGLFKARGFARGHLAPYAVMGGDRDGDGLYAKYNEPSDPDDELTVFQANYLSNIAPQHHAGFNGDPGLWYKLERWIQDDVVRAGGHEVWVFGGCIFGPGEQEVVGPDKDIWVPAMFYKIVVRRDPANPELPKVLAFLFPHQRVAHGDIEDFLVTVDVVEAMSGLDFFSALDDDREEWLEDQDTWQFWPGFASGTGARRDRDPD